MVPDRERFGEGDRPRYLLTIRAQLFRSKPIWWASGRYWEAATDFCRERICRSNGYPQTIRVDQGSEFISRDMDLWAYAKGVTLDFSRPGKPTDNVEAFNGRFRA